MREQTLTHLHRLTVAAEHGFTLIEMIVTILLGMVVLTALVTVMTVSLHQTSRDFSKIDATEHATVGVEQIEEELHSACITDNVTPILSGSTSTNLMFVSQYGTAASLTPVEHQVTFNSSTGAITDSTYAETGVTTNSNDSPVYTFATTPTTTRTVLTNVAQTGTTPVFQYFAYTEPMNGSTPYTAPDGNPYMMLLDGTNEIPGTSTIPAPQPLATPLSTANADNAAEVLISMTVGPSGGSGEDTNTVANGGESFADTGDPVADGVVLRLTPAPNEDSNGAVFLPCQ